MENTPLTLLLVDGSSYLYRAFYAMPNLRSPQGEPTGAIHGMLTMLRKLRKDIPADYIACIFDSDKKTFRDALYAEYKANREKMPDDLKMQIPPLFEIIPAMGWHLICEPDVEADDVIGTLAKQAQLQNIKVIISTGDKDMAQLVTKDITLINTMSEELLDIEGVQKKFGVSPDQIIDYLMLIGDTSDNVPGVEKVGPKTAVKWLAQYQNLNNIIQHKHDFSGKVGENLLKAMTWFETSRQLITIKTDVPLSMKPDELQVKTLDREKLIFWFERFNFKSLSRELVSTESPKDQIKFDVENSETVDSYQVLSSSGGMYQVILTEENLDAFLGQINGFVSVDTETDSLEPLKAKLVGIAMSVETGKAIYLPLQHRDIHSQPQMNMEEALKKIQPILENPYIVKIGQNIKYDRHVFANHGIALRGEIQDTLLLSYVLESHNTHNLDDLAKRHLSIKTITYADVVGRGVKAISFMDVPIEQAVQYAGEDADITLRLYEKLFKDIQQQTSSRFIYEKIEQTVSEVLFKMERNGVLIDSYVLDEQSRVLTERIHQIEQQAFNLAGQSFNLASPKQLRDILFSQMGIKPIKKTPQGEASTDEEVLEKLAEDYPLPKLLLKHREFAKLKSTYIDKLPRMVNPMTGRVHTNYNQAVAVTGRLASQNPNLQNIPIRTIEGRAIRRAFIAPPQSLILSADYSQIELRIMAHLSEDKNMLQAFSEDKDIHTATASEIFGMPEDTISSEQRRIAKTINFGLIYGMSAFGLARSLGLTRNDAQSYIDRYFQRYTGVARYMESTRLLARQQQYVETYFGRRLYLPEINDRNRLKREGAERAAINAPMQGTSADLIKLAMIKIDQWIDTERLQTKLIMQVHDELVFEVPETELPHVQDRAPLLMTQIATLKVPLRVSVGVGKNWEEAH